MTAAFEAVARIAYFSGSAPRKYARYSDVYLVFAQSLGYRVADLQVDAE